MVHLTIARVVGRKTFTGNERHGFLSDCDVVARDLPGTVDSIEQRQMYKHMLYGKVVGPFASSLLSVVSRNKTPLSWNSVVVRRVFAGYDFSLGRKKCDNDVIDSDERHNSRQTQPPKKCKNGPN